jgi:hypothetical protein
LPLVEEPLTRLPTKPRLWAQLPLPRRFKQSHLLRRKSDAMSARTAMKFVFVAATLSTLFAGRGSASEIQLAIHPDTNPDPKTCHGLREFPD